MKGAPPEEAPLVARVAASFAQQAVMATMMAVVM